MKARLSPRRLFAIAPSIPILLLVCTPVDAQWLKVPIPPNARGPDGKVNLSAPAPRLPDGRPDLSGTWEPRGPRQALNIAADLKPDEVPFQPWAKTFFDERTAGLHPTEEPTANCMPAGVPMAEAGPVPWKLIQTPGFIVIIYEAMNLWRQIFFDGRELADDFNPAWYGYSTGKWEGDTLVVDAKGFNGKAWLDSAGHRTTDALHVIERFKRKDFGHLEVQITIDDPKAYTKPWTVTQQLYWTQNEPMEMICNENNRDLINLRDAVKR